MTATINASTSSGVVITPDNSGNILLQYNGVAAPAFSVYKASNQTISSSNVWTKITFDTETFDTANCFSSSTFTPTVAGYYQFEVGIRVSCAATINYCFVAIAKNGTNFVESAMPTYLSTYAVGRASGLVYLNGTTDYIEAYTLMDSSSTKTVEASLPQSNFQGCLLRGA